MTKFTNSKQYDDIRAPNRLLYRYIHSVIKNLLEIFIRAEFILVICIKKKSKNILEKILTQEHDVSASPYRHY